MTALLQLLSGSRKLALAAMLGAICLIATSCGGDGGAAGGGGHEDHMGGGDEMDEGSVPGSAADAADADREVTVFATDKLRFDPETIEVEQGEVITFVVQNKGSSEHEFVLGDAPYHEAHEEGMHDDGMMMDMESAVTLEPGETKELTWEFSEAGEVLYGCHVSGHYDGGMVGTIEVS